MYSRMTISRYTNICLEDETMNTAMNIDKKTIDIFKAESPDAPLVILNAYTRSGGEVIQKCRQLGCPDFTLAEITNLDWNNTLSPWKADSINQGDAPFGGQADEYLDSLLNRIIPAVKNELNGEPRYVILVGYSLAGLFALYAAAECDAFRAVASCSGSMWYPGFKEYIMSRNPSKLPRAAYFSLGDREARTGNDILRTVEEYTREISEFLAENGVRTVFDLNKGNHFQQPALRTAKGIHWILDHSE